MKMTHTSHSISNSNHTRCAASDVMHGSSTCTHPRALITCIYAVFSFGLNQQDCLVLESAERFLHGHQDGMLSALFFADWAAMCQDGMLSALLFADWAVMCQDDMLFALLFADWAAMCQDGMLFALLFADWAAVCQDGMLSALLFADWAAMCHDSSQGAERSKCCNCVLPNNTLSPKPCICCRW